MSSILGAAMTGLAAAQAGLQTTSHNLSNVNTPGFTRQSVVQGTAVAVFNGGAYIGCGTSIESVRRIYSEHLQAEMRSLTSQSTQSSAYATELQRLNDFVAAPETAISSAVDSFFSAVQAVAAHPAEVSARQSMLSAAQVTAQRFRTLGERLDSVAHGINGRISSIVDDVNTAATQIASFNRQIVRVSGSGAAFPNDLLDQRDALIMELNRRVGATVAYQDDGSANVFLSNGQALVVGAASQPLAAGTDALDGNVLRVGVAAGADLRLFQTGEITGGELGGLLAFRDEALSAAQDGIGRLAMVLADEINTLHRLGLDLNGQPGGDVFSSGAPQAQSAATNTGTGALTLAVTDHGALQASDYRVDWDGSQYQITRSSDGTRTSVATLPATLDGITLTMSGAPAAGDSFLARPVRAAANSFALSLAGVNQVAAASPVRGDTAAANTGDVRLAALEVESLDPNLAATVTLTFTSATSFDVAGAGTTDPAGVGYSSGGWIRYNGWALQLAGLPAAGDTITIRANTGGQGDNRNALRLAALSGTRPVDGASFTGAFAQMVSGLGSQQREVDLAVQTQTTMLEQSKAAVSSVSGVNLDEEAANLIRYQQAFQAASRAISVVNTLFEEILSVYR